MESLFDLILLWGGIFIMIVVVGFMVKEGITDEFPLVYVGVILFFGIMINKCIQ